MAQQLTQHAEGSGALYLAWGLLIAAVAAFAILGVVIARKRGISSVVGGLAGVVLGPIGLVLVAVWPRSPQTA